MKSQSAIAAKEIKQALKKAFPNVTFSAKSDNYSGGSSVNIYWSFGPTRKQVEKYTQGRQYGHFDGMTDCYIYEGAGMEVTASGAVKEMASAKYVFENRENSTNTPFAQAVMQVIGTENGWVKKEEFGLIDWQPVEWNGVENTASNKYYRLMNECSFVSDNVEFIERRWIGYGENNPGYEPYTIIYKDLVSGKIYDSKAYIGEMHMPIN